MPISVGFVLPGTFLTVDRRRAPTGELHEPAVAGVPWRKGVSLTRTRRHKCRRAVRAPSAHRQSPGTENDDDRTIMKSLRQGFTAAALSSVLLASTPSELMMRAHASRLDESIFPAAFTFKDALDDPHGAAKKIISNINADVNAIAPSSVSMRIPSGTPTTLDGEETSNVRLFQEATPSVVFITNKQLAGGRYNLDANAVPVGAGSGFVYDDKGTIVTNFHVVKGAKELTVTFQGDPKVYEGRLLGYDEDKDVAVLRVDKANVRPIPLGCSSTLKVGQKIFAIGNPFGLDHTLTTGIVSGLGREIDSGNTGRPIQGVIQTDAAVNPGNSGGPLLDSSGRLVGINTAILSASGSSSGVSFALPIDDVKIHGSYTWGIVEQIIQFGRVTRPVLGLVLAPDTALPQLLGPAAPQGVLVLGVAENGPAQRAGILGTSRDRYTGDVILGDVVTGLNGEEVKNSSDLYRVLDSLKVGDDVAIRVQRRGVGDITIDVTLGEKVTRFER